MLDHIGGYIMAPYYRTAAYRSAVAHPYHVSAYADWSAGCEPVTVGFQSEADARTFASLRPEPLIDLVQRDCGVIAARRMLAPMMAPHAPAFVGRDDFPDLRP